ncbi:PRA1 family protein F3-like [Wolffia australiana]
MTTYGTIPTSSSPGGSNLEFISREKARVKAALETRRPWKEMVHWHAFSLPHSLGDAYIRIRTNLGYFTMNYAIVVLVIVFLALIWHPISLIVLTAMIAAWLFLYFMRDEPLVIFHRMVSDKLVLLLLSMVTIVALFLTNVTYNLIASLSTGVLVVVVHGVFRKTEDLCLDDVPPQQGGWYSVIGETSGGP